MSRQDCMGDNNVNLMDVWTRSNYCWSLYYELMYNNAGRPGYSSAGFDIVSTDITSLIDNYLGRGYKFTEPGLDGYNVFQDVLLRICNRFPGSCQKYLESYCPVQSGIQDNTGLINFCGCYTEQQEYNGNVGRQQCQPLCNRVSNVKLPDGSGSVLSCTDNVCVIDNVSVTASATENGRSSTGNVSFTQVCRCPQGQCKCIIGSTNLYGITGETYFNQVCGEGSVCYTISDNPNQPPVEVKCPELLAVSDTSSNYNSYITWFIIIVIVSLVFIIFIL